jgi:hypothetical protein
VFRNLTPKNKMAQERHHAWIIMDSFLHHIHFFVFVSYINSNGLTRNSVTMWYNILQHACSQMSSLQHCKISNSLKVCFIQLLPVDFYYLFNEDSQFPSRTTSLWVFVRLFKSYSNFLACSLAAARHVKVLPFVKHFLGSDNGKLCVCVQTF